jgi:DNA-binding NarL/FixJ family response regulator
VALVAEHRPDVVLMDIRMPRLGGIEATRRILAAGDAPHVLILTTYDTDENVFDALEAGAVGFLVKDTPPVQLLAAVKAAVDGGAVISPTTTRRLVDHLVAARLRRERPPAPALGQLTDREREVLGLVAEGLSNDEIAARLVISPATAKTHVSRTMIKLGARDRAQLVVYAYEAGLIRPGWLT